MRHSSPPPASRGGGRQSPDAKMRHGKRAGSPEVSPMPTRGGRATGSNSSPNVAQVEAKEGQPVRPSASAQLLLLRRALEAAQAAGLGLDDELVNRAQAVLSERDAREAAAKREMHEALVATRDLAQIRFNMKPMRELKDRLSNVLVVGRALGLSESDLSEAQSKRRQVHNMMEDLKGQIRVFCRVRPLNPKETREGDVEEVYVLDDMSLEVPNIGSFAYDGVFSPGSQEEVFEDCRDLVQTAVDGHNVTIFAYGQTGAGKTHTMYGDKGDKEGIAPRSIAELFEIIGRLSESYDFTVTGSMIELYNNHLVDLLRPLPKRGTMSANGPKLSVRQDKAGNMQVQEMKEQEVKDAPQLRALLDRGIAQRTVASNTMNIVSSRSHLIFTIKVTSVNLETRETLNGKILLCDLGGSERLKKTEATGDRKTEAIEINKSLTALGDVIEAVAKRQKQVPYRNHKLTQIMQDSLGGTAKTLMFVNCSPALSSIDETVMSLKYAARVKKITNWAGTPSHSPTKSRDSCSWAVSETPFLSPQASPHQSPNRALYRNCSAPVSRAPSQPVSRCASVSRRAGMVASRELDEMVTFQTADQR